MKKKQKNPLYVVKGDNVEAANNLLDLMVKKLNLTPVVNFVMTLFKMLLENIRTYAAFEVVFSLFDDILKRLELFKKYSIV